MPYGCPWCNGMMGPGMLLWGWVWLLFLILLIVGGAWITRQGISRPDSGERKSSDRAVQILRERYARGEISKEEFEAQKKDLAA